VRPEGFRAHLAQVQAADKRSDKVRKVLLAKRLTPPFIGFVIIATMDVEGEDIVVRRLVTGKKIG
jgi:hypothetical protein